MPPCAACGRPLEAGARFCTACGANVAVPAAPAPVVAPGAPEAAPSGPTGRVQEPWVVPVLTLVTLSIYQYVWLWRVTREVDAWRASPPHAHRAARRAVAFALAGTLVFVVAFGSLLWLAAMVPVPEGEPLTDSPFQGLAAPQVLAVGVGLVAGLALMMVGVVWSYVASWRVWSALEADGARRGVKPLSPPLMLLLMLLPYVNIVGTFWVLWRTQKELNAAWAATSPEVVPRLPGSR